jgi:hypothetical protein
MEISQGELHETLVATYQTLELARLNQVLKGNGISDVATRRRICEEYFFDSGYFLDSCWFSDQGARFRPGVYFSEIGPSGEETAKLHLPAPSAGTMFHEYAHGNAGWLFDDHAEDASEIETGDVNDRG